MEVKFTYLQKYFTHIFSRYKSQIKKNVKVKCENYYRIKPNLI